ncbi:MAG: flagellar protein FliT [Chitinispirillaceae bacterium]|nr:flagellar protein FliT [Chitinispirillaceae bacterium]
MEDQTALIEKIRDQYYDIQLLTMHCCSDISPEAIPDMIRQRAELINLITSEELLISEETPDVVEAPSASEMRAEIKSIMATIITLDKQVETVIRNHMKRLKSDLSVLYKTSKAASAYAIQSRV